MQPLTNTLMSGSMDYAIVAAAYILLLFTSGKIVSYFLKQTGHKSLAEAASEDNPQAEQKRKRLAAGVLIGKCENILILSFILLEAYTALALVVTAKTLVRKEEIEKNEVYFLAGTLINVSYSVLTGLVVRIVLQELN